MDNDLIENKLLYLKDLLKKLEKNLKKYKEASNLDERETFFAASSKFLEEIIETTIKINTILLKEKDEFASTYYQSFIKLSENYKIDKEKMIDLAKITSLRNKVTHEYDSFLENIDSSIKEFQLISKKIPEYIKIIKNLIN